MHIDRTGYNVGQKLSPSLSSELNHSRRRLITTSLNPQYLHAATPANQAKLALQRSSSVKVLANIFIFF